MRILGLDLSLTAPGVACIAPPLQPIGRLVHVPSRLGGVERLAHIATAVMNAVEECEPEHIAIEGYSFASRVASHAHAIGELGGVVRYRLHQAGCTYVEIPPGKWRKQLFGRGNLPKDQVRVEALKRYGIEFDSLDVLEAWCVATALFRTLQGLDRPSPRRRQRASA